MAREPRCRSSGKCCEQALCFHALHCAVSPDTSGQAPFPCPLVMSETVAVHSQEITDLVATYPDGVRLSQLAETVGQRFGKSITFHTGSAMGMDFDGLIAFLEARNKVRVTGGVVFPGGSPVGGG